MHSRAAWVKLAFSIVRILVLQAAGSLCVEAPRNLVRPAARILGPGPRARCSLCLLPKPHICSALP